MNDIGQLRPDENGPADAAATDAPDEATDEPEAAAPPQVESEVAVTGSSVESETGQ